MSLLDAKVLLGQSMIQALSLLACLVPTALTAHGGTKRRPAGDERHRQKSGSPAKVWGPVRAGICYVARTFNMPCRSRARVLSGSLLVWVVHHGHLQGGGGPIASNPCS